MTCDKCKHQFQINGKQQYVDDKKMYNLLYRKEIVGIYNEMHNIALCITCVEELDAK